MTVDSAISVYLRVNRGSLFRVTLYALKSRYITEVHRMFERLVGLVTSLTLPIRKRAEIDRMLKRLRLRRRGWTC